MNLTQLKVLTTIHQTNYHLSSAAKKLHMSQPNVSKLLCQLEEELGVLLFHRSGKRLTSPTEIGELIIQQANKTLQEVTKLKAISDNYLTQDEGSLSIATTHTQARYVLPNIIQTFKKTYPKVTLHMHQGSPSITRL